VKNTVKPFGIGKVMVGINLNDLPDEIREGLIELTSRREEKYQITKETEGVLIVGDVVPWNSGI